MIINYLLNKNRIIFNAIASLLLTIYFLITDANPKTIIIFTVISILHLIIYFKSKNMSNEI